MHRAEYQLAEADIIQFHMFCWADSEVFRKQCRKFRLIVFLVYLVLSAPLYLSGVYVGAVLFTSVAVAWFLLSPSWLQRRSRRHYAKRIRETVGDSLREPVKVELHPDGIHSLSYLGESVFRYTAVDRIVEDGGYTYVFIGKGMAIVLPHDRVPKETITALVTEIGERAREAGKHLETVSQSPDGEPATDG